MSHSSRSALARRVPKDLLGLKRLFSRAESQYAELSSRAEASVTRWVWTTSSRYHLDPLFFCDKQKRPGRVGKPPRDKAGWVAYGFSDDDRILAQHQYVLTLPGRRYETFYVESKDRILGYHFDQDDARACINVSQLRFSDEQHPSVFQRYAIHGWVTRSFVSSKGRIRSYDETFQQRDDPRQRLSGELRYSLDNRVEHWVRWPGSRTRRLEFRGTPPGNPFLRN
jgi:hypothetical protein